MYDSSLLCERKKSAYPFLLAMDLFVVTAVVVNGLPRASPLAYG